MLLLELERVDTEAGRAMRQSSRTRGDETMNSDVRNLDERIRELVESDAVGDATDLALRVYGDKLYNYIRKLVHSDLLAEEAFQETSVELWESWTSFEWNSSVETWVFSTARHVSYQLIEREQRKQKKERRFRTGEQRELVDRWTRTVTKNFEKTEAKDWLWQTVEELPPEKRELLVLRIGHDKQWKEVARIMEGDELDDDELTRASRRLRKKYQRLKKTLREHTDEFKGQGSDPSESSD